MTWIEDALVNNFEYLYDRGFELDWRLNVHVAHDPYCKFSDKRFVSSVLSTLEEKRSPVVEHLKIHYVDQGTEEWLSLKKPFISSSEIGAALEKNKFEPRLLYILSKAGRLKKIWSEKTEKLVFPHGHKYEPYAGHFFTHHQDDVSIQFGLLPHYRQDRMFMANSPDLTMLGLQDGINPEIAEIKSPYDRAIQFPYEMAQITKEIFYQGKQHLVHLLTNLTEQDSNLIQNMEYYYQQCQLQMEVMNIGEKCHFVQYGVNPNPYFLDKNLLTATHVEREFDWFEKKHGETIRKVWDQIVYYANNPLPSNMYRDPITGSEYNTDRIDNLLRNEYQIIAV